MEQVLVIPLQLKVVLVTVSLFNGIPTFVVYLMPKPFFEMNSGDTI